MGATHRAFWGPVLVGLSLLGFGCGGGGGGNNQNDNQNNSVQTICGNGVVEGAEECDEGSGNSDSAPDTCRSDCRLPFCGDGVVDAGESCDAGYDNSDVVPDRCRTDCQEPRCGDGVVDFGYGELCDDGNTLAEDGCSPECVPEYCGNGVLDPGEECDDGNFRPGDGCGPTCLLEVCGNGFVDAAVGESCDDGNLDDHDGCSSQCRVEIPTWHQLSGLRPRSYHGAVYDSARGVVVVYGGFDSQLLSDTWEHDGIGWRQVFTLNSPGLRRDFAMAYDETRGVTVLHGGGPCGFSLCGDTWEYDGVDWVEISTSTRPSARNRHSMAFDASRGVSVMFGGVRVFNDQFRSDTWEYDGVDWVERSPASSPPGRHAHGLAYDAARARVVLFGGRCSDGSPPECNTVTWVWDGSNWYPNLTMPRPPARQDHAVAYDSQRDMIWMYGGGYDDGETYTALTDTWRWNGSSWYEVTDDSDFYRIEGRQGHAMAFHPALGGTLLVDGAMPARGDTWIFDGTAWARLDAPEARDGHCLAYDEIRGVVVLYGGQALSLFYTDTWELDGDVWLQRHPEHHPPYRKNSAMAFDGQSGRVILFGGFLKDESQETDETWAWDGEDWDLWTPGQSPSPREGASLGYDRDRGRLVLFGGRISGVPDTYYADTWEMDGQSWVQVSTAQSPPPRAFASLAYSVTTSRLVLLGGSDLSGQLVEPWEYDGSTWTPITVAGTSPPARAGVGVGALEATGDVLLFGGGGGFGTPPTNETWSLRPQGWINLTPALSPPPRTALGCLVHDSLSRRVILFGGSPSPVERLDDTWVFRYASVGP